ncbi:MAG: hypothetical protein WCT10_05550, partial [Patescibacteria group bacterium]
MGKNEKPNKDMRVSAWPKFIWFKLKNHIGDDPMRKFLALLLAITAIVSPIGFIADASGPSSNRILNYQLRLTDAAGVAVADGVKKLKLTIYDDPTAGNQKFTACSLDGSATGTPTKVNATFTGGVASILLGSALTCDTG